MFRLIAILGELNLANLMRGQLRDEDWPKVIAAIVAIANGDARRGLSPRHIVEIEVRRPSE